MLMVAVPPSWQSERTWVIELVLKEWLGLECAVTPDDRSDVRISMTDDPGGASVTVVDRLFECTQDEWLTEPSLPRLPLRDVPTTGVPGSPVTGTGVRAGPIPSSLPIIYDGAQPADRLVRTSETDVAITFDLFGSVFFMLSRYEESVIADRDEHGRFPAASSVAYQGGFLERPIVDEMVAILRAALAIVWPRLPFRSTEYRLHLTHDVDHPWSSWRRPLAKVLRSSAADVAARRDPRLAVQRLRAAIDVRRGRIDRDPYDTYDRLMDVSEAHGLRSTFYFIADIDSSGPDFRYQVTDPPIRRLIGHIAQRGHVIGLHGSYASFGDMTRLAAESAALTRVLDEMGVQQETWGIRQHYLRFSSPRSWRDQLQAGFDHDSTVAYAENIGFRSGTCRDYRPFDVLAREELDIVERPLTVMEGTLFVYMGLGLEEGLQAAVRVFDECRRHQTPATLLVHNHALAMFGMDPVYDDLIATLARP